MRDKIRAIPEIVSFSSDAWSSHIYQGYLSFSKWRMGIAERSFGLHAISHFTQCRDYFNNALRASIKFEHPRKYPCNHEGQCQCHLLCHG